MNAKQFLALLDKGNSLQREDFQALVRLHETFPYFVVPKILAAKYERENTGGSSTELLHWAAVQSPDRKRLKQLVEQDIDFLPPSTEIKAIRAADVKDAPVASGTLEKAAPEGEEVLSSQQSREEILKRLEENLSRFKNSSKKATEENPQPGEPNKLKKEIPPEDLISSIKKKEKKAILDARKKEQNNLIKAFNKKSIQIAAIKEGHSTAEITDLSENSTTFSDKIVSESFARLLAKQNNKKEAIKIYQKLILKFPEKSAYFAALIKELEE